MKLSTLFLLLLALWAGLEAGFRIGHTPPDAEETVSESIGGLNQ